MGFLALLRDLARPRGEVDYPLVSADDERVTCVVGEGRRESVAWRDLDEVRIVTTSDGPFAEDVFFVLIGRGAGCVVPHARVASILDRLQALPGFDHARMIDAMGSTREASFTVWRRAS